MDPRDIERQLRARLTEREYNAVVSRLKGALEAVAMIQERAPDLMRVMSIGAFVTSAAGLSDEAKAGLNQLVAALVVDPLVAEPHTRQMLKLVHARRAERPVKHRRVAHR